MRRLDTLTIQKNIEEKRLILGKIFEEFLLKNLRVFLQKIDEVLCAKNFCFWSVLTIFLSSVYLRSLLDIGGDSAVYIRLAEKISRGGKYYYDFFESNFPLSFWLHVIPYKIANFFHISPIISAEIFINFCGILSLFFSAKILEKSALKQAHKNLLITSFAVGFFLRINALGVNEFLTKTSFFLCFAYPYIAFSFFRKRALSKKEMLFRGLMGGIIPCIKPHYILLPMMIEISRFWQKKSLKFFVEIDKLVMCLVGIFYLFLMIKFTPEFFEFMVPMWSSYYYASDSFLSNLFDHLSSKILFFGAIFLIFLRQKFSADDKILLLAFLSASFLLIIESVATIDQRACFFSLIIPVFVKIFYDFLKSERIIFNKMGLACTFFLILAFVEPRSFYVIARISVFWWIIIPILTINFFKKIKSSQIKLIIISSFVLLAGVSFKIAAKNQEIYMLISALVIFIFLFFYEKIYAKFNKNFSAFFVFTQFFLAATLLAFTTSSISDAYYGRGSPKFPNSFTDEVAKYSKTYAIKNEDEIVIASNFISFPIVQYLGKIENYIHHNFNLLYLSNWKNFDQVVSDKSNFGFVRNYFLKELKSLIKDQNIKIIFVDNESMVMKRNDRCMVSFLENYFSDKEFKKIFLQNYGFVGRIFLTEAVNNDKRITFFSEVSNEPEELDLPKSRPIYDFEVYARKNN